MSLLWLGYEWLASILLILSCSLTYSDGCHLLCYDLWHMWQKTERGLESAATKKLHSVQWPVRTWILPTTTQVSLEADLLPLKPWDDCSPSRHTLIAAWLKTLKQQTQPSHARFLTHTDCEIIYICCFKSLIWEIICYIAIDN